MRVSKTRKEASFGKLSMKDGARARNGWKEAEHERASAEKRGRNKGRQRDKDCERELKKGRTKTQSRWKCEYARGAKKSRLREKKTNAGGRSLHPSVKFGFMLPSRPREREREKKNCMNLKENREPRAPGTNGNKREEGGGLGGGTLQCETLTQKV